MSAHRFVNGTQKKDSRRMQNLKQLGNQHSLALALLCIQAFKPFDLRVLRVNCPTVDLVLSMHC